MTLYYFVHAPNHKLFVLAHIGQNQLAINEAYNLIHNTKISIKF